MSTHEKPALLPMPEHELRRCLMAAGGGWLKDDLARAALVLWTSGAFDTHSIAVCLAVREDAVMRTIHMARDGARITASADAGNGGRGRAG